MTRGVVRLVSAERTPYLVGSIFVVFSTMTALAYPYVVRQIMDDAISAGNLEKLTQLSLVMIVILVTEAVATLGRDYCIGLGAERVGLVRRLPRRINVVAAEMAIRGCGTVDGAPQP